MSAASRAIPDRGRSTRRLCCFSAFMRSQFIQVAGPVVLEQPRKRAVCQDLSASLAAGAVVGFVIGVANALHRGAANRTRLPEAAMYGHLGTEGGYAFGKII